MKEILLTSSVLITALLVLRLVFAKKVSRTLIYGAWALVALRLLVPVQIGQLDFSVLTATQEVSQAIEQASARPVSGPTQQEVYKDIVLDYLEKDQTAFTPQVQEQIRQETAQGTVTKEEIADKIQQQHPQQEIFTPQVQEQVQQQVAQSVTAPTLGQVATVVWLSGVAAMAVWFAFVNLRHRRSLGRGAQRLDCSSPIPVYLTENAASPCLVGLLRPTVYLTPASITNEESRRHVLAHELTHYAHRDHIWSLLRGLCLCVYWFDPLVWAAAYFSRRDCELACDEGALKRLGEAERIPYGKTLLEVVGHTATAAGLLQTATAMAETKKQLKERVNYIVKRPKVSLIAVICMVLVCTIVAGCVAAGPAVSKDPAGTAPPTASTAPAGAVQPTTTAPADGFDYAKYGTTKEEVEAQHALYGKGSTELEIADFVYGKVTVKVYPFAMNYHYSVSDFQEIGCTSIEQYGPYPDSEMPTQVLMLTFPDQTKQGLVAVMERLILRDDVFAVIPSTKASLYPLKVITELTEEAKQEINAAWLTANNTELDWNAKNNIGESCVQYQGSYGGYHILMTVEDRPAAGTEYAYAIGPYTMIYDCPFDILVLVDGAFVSLAEAYEQELVTGEVTLTAIMYLSQRYTIMPPIQAGRIHLQQQMDVIDLDKQLYCSYTVNKEAYSFGDTVMVRLTVKNVGGSISYTGAIENQFTNARLVYDGGETFAITPTKTDTVDGAGEHWLQYMETAVYTVSFVIPDDAPRGSYVLEMTIFGAQLRFDLDSAVEEKQLKVLTDLPEETQAAINPDYGYDYYASYADSYHIYGEFGDVYVFYPYGFSSMGSSYEIVNDVCFLYGSGKKLCVYTAEGRYSMAEAFEKGLLTAQQVREVLYNLLYMRNLGVTH